MAMTKMVAPKKLIKSESAQRLHPYAEDNTPDPVVYKDLTLMEVKINDIRPIQKTD